MSVINTSHNLIEFIKNKGNFDSIKNLIPIYINEILKEILANIEKKVQDLDHLLSIFLEDLITLLNVDGC